jgi:hypothetical protein
LDDVDESAQTHDGAHLLDLCVDDVGRSGVADLGELAGWLATAGTVPILLDSVEVNRWTRRRREPLNPFLRCVSHPGRLPQGGQD